MGTITRGQAAGPVEAAIRSRAMQARARILEAGKKYESIEVKASTSNFPKLRLRFIFQQYDKVATRQKGAVILREVTDKHDITVADIRSPRRFKKLTAARREACWRLSAETSLSNTQIARLIGYKDHTTVLHHVSKWRRENGGS